jgi:hypothetical protein
MSTTGGLVTRAPSKLLTTGGLVTRAPSKLGAPMLQPPRTPHRRLDDWPRYKFWASAAVRFVPNVRCIFTNQARTALLSRIDRLVSFLLAT